jgi:hypothetical protein
MSSMTAQLAVGTPDRYHGGIRPTHVAWLSENDRPGWGLEHVWRDIYGDPFGQERAEDEEPLPWTETTTVWLPSAPENILQDGLLLIACHVLWGEEGCRELVEKLGVPELLDFYRLELEKMPPEPLADLRRRAREIDLDYTLVVTVLRGSSVLSQLPVLEDHSMGLEVCTPSYSRLRPRAWGGDLEVTGSLEPPPGAGHRYHALNIH